MPGVGGYQPPEKPAAVSGPGKFAARTDGQPGTQPIRDLPDAGYGEQATFREMQAGAPMADSQGTPAGPPPGMGGGPAPVPLSAPTEAPDEPITAGVDLGDGPGSEVLGTPSAPTPADIGVMQKFLPLMQPHANSADSSDQFKGMVRYIENLASQQTMNG